MVSRLTRRFGLGLLTSLLAALAAVTLGCGGTPPAVPNGTSTGNWQFNLVQNFPTPATSFGVSGFMVEGHDGAVTGSLEVPPLGKKDNCAGVASASGNIDGQNVTLALNVFGTVVNLTGTVSTDGTSMSGDYQGPAGECFTQATTGTWSAFLVPPLNGNFTGQIMNSSYMGALLGDATTVPPVVVSGTFTQSDNAGGSNATLAGVINAVNYPCFTTASFTGTISGQNVYLTIYGYNGEQIATLGSLPTSSGSGSPALVEIGQSGLSLIDEWPSASDYLLGTSSGGGTLVGTCPPVLNQNGNMQTYDSGTTSFIFQ